MFGELHRISKGKENILSKIESLDHVSTQSKSTFYHWSSLCSAKKCWWPRTYWKTWTYNQCCPLHISDSHLCGSFYLYSIFLLVDGKICKKLCEASNSKTEAKKTSWRDKVQDKIRVSKRYNPYILRREIEQ